MNWLFHIGIAQSLFAAVLLFTRRQRNPADLLLAWWMIFIAIELTHMLLEVTNSRWHGLSSNFGFYSLTFGPFLFLYTGLVTGTRDRLWRMDFLHFLPYLLFAVVHLMFFTNRSIRADDVQTPALWFVLNILRVITLLISLSVYSLLSIRILKNHEKSIGDHYSFVTLTINLRWLRHIILIFIITYLVLVINILSGNIAYTLFHTSHFIPAAGLTFFCFSLSYFGFNQQVIYESSTKSHPAAKETGSLTLDMWMKYVSKLEHFLIIEKPYLNAELTIGELAEAVKLPRHYITEILKTHYNKNFFTLINEYRVREAQVMLVDENARDLPVLQIAFNCGFNSKSSFNALFRQYVGVTPSAYRAQKQKAGLAGF